MLRPDAIENAGLEQELRAALGGLEEPAARSAQLDELIDALGKPNQCQNAATYLTDHKIRPADLRLLAERIPRIVALLDGNRAPIVRHSALQSLTAYLNAGGSVPDTLVPVMGLVLRFASADDAPRAAVKFLSALLHRLAAWKKPIDRPTLLTQEVALTAALLHHADFAICDVAQRTFEVAFIQHHLAPSELVALHVLVAFLQLGDPVHDVLYRLRQNGLYTDVAYNRAITAMARRSGYRSWQVGSVLVTSMGILHHVSDAVPLPSPDGTIPLGVQFEPYGQPDALGYQPVRFIGGGKGEWDGDDEENAESLLLFRPGYRAWRQFRHLSWSARLKRSEVFLLGVDADGSSVFYLMPWGEVLRCCTLFFEFVRDFRAREEAATAYFAAHRSLDALWEEVEAEVTPAMRDHLLQGARDVPAGVVEWVLALRDPQQQRFFASKTDANNFLRHGFTRFLAAQGPEFAYRLGVVGQFYHRISGHAEAINARMKNIQGPSAKAVLRPLSQTSPLPMVDFAMAQDTAARFGLRHGGYRERLPARQIWDLFALLETEGLIPRTEVPPPGPLSDQPGFTLQLLEGLERGVLQLIVNGQRWTDLNVPFPENAIVVLSLQEAGLEEMMTDGRTRRDRLDVGA